MLNRLVCIQQCVLFIVTTGKTMSQEQLMEELLDKDAKSELESELCINWSEEVRPKTF